MFTYSIINTNSPLRKQVYEEEPALLAKLQVNSDGYEPIGILRPMVTAALAVVPPLLTILRDIPTVVNG